MTQRTRDPFSLLFINDDAQLQKRIISNVLQHDPARRSSTKKSKNNLLNARSKRKGIISLCQIYVDSHAWLFGAMHEYVSIILNHQFWGKFLVVNGCVLDLVQISQQKSEASDFMARKGTIHANHILYESLPWMFRPFWVGFPYNHYLLGWLLGGTGRYEAWWSCSCLKVGNFLLNFVDS